MHAVVVRQGPSDHRDVHSRMPTVPTLVTTIDSPRSCAPAGRVLGSLQISPYDAKEPTKRSAGPDVRPSSPLPERRPTSSRCTETTGSEVAGPVQDVVRGFTRRHRQERG